MRYPRYICIHGHFYQPPRENPWLGVVEVEDSAAPFHDWNERITRECYAPNTRARLLDHDGRIIKLLNNYAWMSFNFGPTLLQWMAGHAPEVHQGIVEADRLSQSRRGGHGNALAQVYNHLIMPLASKHDKETQVAWGIADFRHRFGRDPEGMWLAETAVDTESLEVLAEAGIAFTILAPRQAKRWRKKGSKEWQELADGVDPSRAYLCRLPSGRSIALFFLDAIVSHQVAFERLLDDGQRFLDRLSQRVRRSPRARPAHAHRHRRRVVWSPSRSRRHGAGVPARPPGRRPGRAADQLRRIPRAAPARVGGRDSRQQLVELRPRHRALAVGLRLPDARRVGATRGAVRSAARSTGSSRSSTTSSARGDASAFPTPGMPATPTSTVILNRDCDDAIRSFLDRHGHPDLDHAQVVAALRLLEMQTDAMLMFTSCGWFHDEISGIETVQCLQYAARAIYLAKQFGRDLEAEFRGRPRRKPRAMCPSSATDAGCGSNWSGPGVVDLERVLAHHAISLIYQPADEGEPPAGLLVRPRNARKGSADARARASGLRPAARPVAPDLERGRGPVRGHPLRRPRFPRRAQPRARVGADHFESLKPRLLEAYRTGSLADITSLVAREFPGRSHRLDDLFRDEQRRIIGIVLEDRFADYQRSFELLANQDEEVLNRLGQLSYPIPKPLRAAASTLPRHPPRR